MILLLTICLILCYTPVSADFAYTDFNQTDGLEFNGDSATSTCGDNEISLYQPRHGSNDAITVSSGFESIMETTDRISEKTVETRTDATPLIQNAGFGTMRNVIAKDPNGCSGRLRLTPSRPRKRSSVWRNERSFILDGFETSFRFHINDHSKFCEIVRDRDFSSHLYKSCMVHGGDGFAFLIHNDPNTTSTLGVGGQDLGYGGIRNAIAIEFDMWYNPEQDGSQSDHVSIQVSGPLGALTSQQSTRLVSPKLRSMGDCMVHTVIVKYSTDIAYSMISKFSASANLIPYLQDNGENHRIGTLVVFVDNSTDPMFVIPINLSLALALPEGMAYVGFTASTGEAFQKHDILSWYFCEDSNCELRKRTSPIDYHQNSLIRQLRESWKIVH